MATNYTSLLGFALPTTGELDGTWGTVVNDNITELVEDSIAATATASVTSGNWTLSTTGSGAANEARCAILIPTGTPGVSRNIIAPSQSKAYIVINQSDAAVVLKGSATTGTTIAAGAKAVCAWNGSDFVTIATDAVDGVSTISFGTTGLTPNTATSGAVTVAGTLAAANGGTGQTSFTNGQLLIGNASNSLTKATLTQGSGVTITNGDGSITISATGSGGDVVGPASATDNAIARFDLTTGKLIQNSVVTIADTTGDIAGAGSITSTSASGILTRAAATQDGVELVGRAGGTSSYKVTFTPTTLGANRTLTLPDASGTILQSGTAVTVGQGGTGLTTLTANNVILGNGSSNVQFVAPGASGNVLTSDGTTWTSSTPAGGGALTNNTRQAVTSAATTTINLNSGNVIDLTMAANITTLSFTNVPASGTPILIQIVVRNASSGTAYTITWPNSVYWSSTVASASQTAPSLATGANGITVIALLTTDGGTKWRGWVESSIAGGIIAGLYTFGANLNGECGLNTVNIGGGGVSSPTQIGSLTNWAQPAAGGAHSVAVKTDGTLWAWGDNGSGALGQNNVITRSSPVQVGTNTNWASCAAGNNFTMAITTTGQLWGFGTNQYGILGDNTQNTKSSPVQVGSATDWSKISAFWNHWLAIKTNGTLWGCGSNQNGRLGTDSSETARSSPVQIGALTTWTWVSAGFSHSGAIKNDGTLWMWGNNQQGATGDNTLVTKSSPVQIGSTDWQLVSCGGKGGVQFTGAIKTNGTLWMWGNAAQGRLGDNSTVYRSSPVQVGALTTWADIQLSGGTTGAIKTDNSLWTWGYSASGRSGRAYSNDSSPIQVSSLTWATSNGLSMNQWGALARAGTLVNPA